MSQWQLSFLWAVLGSTPCPDLFSLELCKAVQVNSRPSLLFYSEGKIQMYWQNCFWLKHICIRVHLHTSVVDLKLMWLSIASIVCTFRMCRFISCTRCASRSLSHALPVGPDASHGLPASISALFQPVLISAFREHWKGVQRDAKSTLTKCN